MEPLVLKNEHYSFSFYKRTFENIKTCVDKVSAPANGEADLSGTSISTMTNYKIYCACDLALGLVMSKTQNFLLKDFPVQPSLPGKYYTGKRSFYGICLTYVMYMLLQCHNRLPIIT